MSNGSARLIRFVSASIPAVPLLPETKQYAHKDQSSDFRAKIFKGLYCTVLHNCKGFSWQRWQ